jgi:hypothetical protein
MPHGITPFLFYSFENEVSTCKTEKPNKRLLGLFICDRDRIRTCDRLLRRQMLYPAELRDRTEC